MSLLLAKNVGEFVSPAIDIESNYIQMTPGKAATQKTALDPGFPNRSSGPAPILKRFRDILSQ